ncbi:MFS transporter [Rothia sp. AR01]|uniref:MFS transporter n=1 Tax=Rothia santali TaxID=2949643 RepID=A0A9X2H8U9_9MICC|nr:MFS transporter [Rothia santali]
MDNALVAFLLPSMATEWGLGNGPLGLLASATPVGYLIGALMAGWLGDRFGRKPIMMWALAIYTVFTLIAAIAPTFEIFAIARIIAGFGIGAESVIIAPYLSEFVPPARRGWFVACLAGFFSFGYVLAALIGRYIVPMGDQGWRWAQVITAAPIILLLWWRRSLQESPRYLLVKGLRDQAERVVKGFEDKVVEATGKNLTVPTPSGQDDVQVNKNNFLQAMRYLWSRKIRRRTIVIWTIWFVNVFSFYGFFTWIPTLLVQRGIDITQSFNFSIIIYAAQIPGYFSAAWLCEKIERKYTIAIYLVGGAISAYWLSQSSEPGMILASGAVLSFFLNGSVAGTYAYTPELFPTWVRASATGAASAFGRVGSISAPIIIGFASTTWGFGGVFGLTCAVLITGVVIVVIFGLTTSGHSLEEINEAEVE